jgi:hypothetical protein
MKRGVPNRKEQVGKSAHCHIHLILPVIPNLLRSLISQAGLQEYAYFRAFKILITR